MSNFSQKNLNNSLMQSKFLKNCKLKRILWINRKIHKRKKKLLIKSGEMEFILLEKVREKSFLWEEKCKQF